MECIIILANNASSISEFVRCEEKLKFAYLRTENTLNLFKVIIMTMEVNQDCWNCIAIFSELMLVYFN